MSTNIPAHLKYTRDHEWVQLEGNICTVGITDFAQSQLGDIVYLELPSQGKELKIKQSFGVVESIKSVSDLFSPVSGKVVATNKDLESSPDKINQGPYDSWLIKIEVSNPDELKLLISQDEYQSSCNA